MAGVFVRLSIESWASLLRVLLHERVLKASCVPPLRLNCRPVWILPPMDLEYNQPDSDYNANNNRDYQQHGTFDEHDTYHDYFNDDANAEQYSFRDWLQDNRCVDSNLDTRLCTPPCTDDRTDGKFSCRAHVPTCKRIRVATAIQRQSALSIMRCTFVWGLQASAAACKVAMGSDSLADVPALQSYRCAQKLKSHKKKSRRLGRYEQTLAQQTYGAGLEPN